jgi:DUF2934 family protein
VQWLGKSNQGKIVEGGSFMPKKAAATTTTPKPSKSRAAKTAAATHDEIALRAYHIFLERDGAPGNPYEDWTRAERELLEESSKPKSRRKSKVVSIAA